MISLTSDMDLSGIVLLRDRILLRMDLVKKQLNRGMDFFTWKKTLMAFTRSFLLLGKQ